MAPLKKNTPGCNSNCSCTGQCGQIFSETFPAGDEGFMTIESGDWTFFREANALGASYSTADDYALLTYDLGSWSDRVWVVFNPGHGNLDRTNTHNPEVRVWLRRTDDSNGYYASIYPTYGFVVLHKVVSGTDTILQASPMESTPYLFGQFAVGIHKNGFGDHGSSPTGKTIFSVVKLYPIIFFGFEGIVPVSYCSVEIDPDELTGTKIGVGTGNLDGFSTYYFIAGYKNDIITPAMEFIGVYTGDCWDMFSCVCTPEIMLSGGFGSTQSTYRPLNCQPQASMLIDSQTGTWSDAGEPSGSSRRILKCRPPKLTDGIGVVLQIPLTATPGSHFTSGNTDDKHVTLSSNVELILWESDEVNIIAALENGGSDSYLRLYVNGSKTDEKLLRTRYSEALTVYPRIFLGYAKDQVVVAANCGLGNPDDHLMSDFRDSFSYSDLCFSIGEGHFSGPPRIGYGSGAGDGWTWDYTMPKTDGGIVSSQIACSDDDLVCSCATLWECGGDPREWYHWQTCGAITVDKFTRGNRGLSEGDIRRHSDDGLCYSLLDITTASPEAGTIIYILEMTSDSYDVCDDCTECAFCSAPLWSMWLNSYNALWVYSNDTNGCVFQAHIDQSGAYPGGGGLGLDYWSFVIFIEVHLNSTGHVTVFAYTAENQARYEGDLVDCETEVEVTLISHDDVVTPASDPNPVGTWPATRHVTPTT